MHLGFHATIHSTLSLMINNRTTSADAWNKLETCITNRSNTRMLSVMSFLMSNKKEGKIVVTYMSKVKSLIDDLTLIGHPLNDTQIMSYTLNGLINEFKELIAAVCVRNTLISFEDLYDKLLDEELICNHGKPKEEEALVTMQLTQKTHGIRGGYRGSRGDHRGGNNNTTHGLDSNLIGQNFQPMQYNQRLSSYGKGMNSVNFQSPQSWNPNFS